MFDRSTCPQRTSLIPSSDPPAVVIEAIRDFAGSRTTPVFQAYMSRFPLPSEARLHAIYAQLGVTFIQCYDQGKDTADKKIISDMWKFYASYQHYSRRQRIRIILITGDRDFADAIGQLRNLGVEVGILTGKRNATAAVFDDYTIGMRVLPLLGVVKARARYSELDAYQTTRELQNADYNKGTDELSKDNALESIPLTSSIGTAAAPRQGMSKKDSQVDGTKGQWTVDPTTTVTKDAAESLFQRVTRTVEMKASDAENVSEGKSTEPKAPDLNTPSTLSTPLTSMQLKHTTAPTSHLSSAAGVNIQTQTTVSQPATLPEIPAESYATLPQAQNRESRREEMSAWKEIQWVRRFEKQDSKSLFNRLRNFFGLSTTDSRAASQSEARTSTGSTPQNPPASELTSNASHESQLETAAPTSTPTIVGSIISSSEVPIPTSVDHLSTSTHTIPPPQSAPSHEHPKEKTIPETNPEQQQLKPPLLSAIDVVISPPFISRHLTPQIPINESLYGASQLVPPSLERLGRTEFSAGSMNARKILSNLAGFPSTSEKSETQMIDHYTKQVRIHKPGGISDHEIRQILNAWLKIQSWSSEKISDSLLRRVAKMALGSACEIMEVRKEAKEQEKVLQEIKQNELKLANEKPLVGLGEEKVFYRLTDDGRDDQNVKGENGERKNLVGEIRREMDMKADGNKTEANRIAGELEEKSLDREIDDKQLNKSKPEGMTVDSKEQKDVKVQGDELVNKDVKHITVSPSTDTKDVKLDERSTFTSTDVPPTTFGESNTSSEAPPPPSTPTVRTDPTPISDPSSERTQDQPQTWAFEHGQRVGERIHSSD